MSRLLNKISNDFKLKLGVTDFILVSIHLFVGLAFWTIYNLDLTSGTNIKYWVFVYYFLVPLALVGLFFRNLRNFKLYLIWIVIGIKDTRFLTKLNPPPPMKKLTLILSLLTIISNFSFGQNNTDTISMKKGQGGYQFYMGESRLTISQLIITIKPNELAYKQIKSAQASYTMGQVLGYSGGFIIGYQLGSALWSSKVNWRMAGLGAGLIVFSIPISQGFNTKARQAIGTYNSGLQTSASRKKNELKISASANGIGLVLLF